MKLYRIFCNETHETYFGVTNTTIEDRHIAHLISAYDPKGKYCSSIPIILRNNYVMTELLDHPSKQYVLRMEKFLIQNWNCICINYTHNPNHPRKLLREVLKELKKIPKIAEI